MKTIELSDGHVALVDDQDYDLVSRYTWTASMLASGRVYAVTCFREQMLPMHGVIANAAGRVYVDHRNRDALDNRRSNLLFRPRVKSGGKHRARRTR